MCLIIISGLVIIIVYCSLPNNVELHVAKDLKIIHTFNVFLERVGYHFSSLLVTKEWFYIGCL